MKQNFILTPNQNLTKVAKKIFGDDFVEEAYFRHDAKVTSQQIDLDRTIRGGEIIYGDEFSEKYGTSIVIFFRNGKKVSFKSTDWAFIGSFK